VKPDTGMMMFFSLRFLSFFFFGIDVTLKTMIHLTEERASRKAYFEKYLAPHIQAKGDAIKKRKVDDEAANTTAAVEAK
jgi:hypothetical protein